MPQCRYQKLLAMLAYAGTLPLIFCVFAAWLALPHPRQLLSWDLIGLHYGALIAAFMSGILWAVGLILEAASSRVLIVFSNVIVLIVFFCGVLLSALANAIVLIVVFLFLYSVDAYLAKCSLLPVQYLRIRRGVTGIVVLCFVVMGFQLIV